MKLLLTADHIINVTEEIGDVVFGYDLISENFIRANKKECVPFLKSILKILGSEKIRFLVASQFADDENELAKILGISNRTVFRIQKREKMLMQTPSENGD